MASMPPKSGKKKPLEQQVPVDEKSIKVDVSTSDPRTIVLMLDSPELNLVSKACEALLKHIEISEQNLLEVIELGGISKMVRLISSPEKAARCHSMLCLAAMASHADVRCLLYKSNHFIPALLKLLQPEEELMTQERASFALTLLADDYSFKVALGKHSTHQPLLTLIKSTDPDVQRNSIKVLSLLMENFQLRPALYEDNGLSLIISLLDSEYALIQELALITLRSCMHHAPSRQAVASSEGLSRLVAFIGDKECADLHVLAVEVLSLCLGDATSMSVLQGSGSLQQLLSHILTSTDPIMKKNSTNTLAGAALNDLNRKILHENEAEKTFIELLSNEENEVVEAACAVLANMANLNSSQQLIGIEGGVTELIKHLGKESSDSTRAAAVHCLACLLIESPANCRLVADNGGLEHLVLLLTDGQAVCCQFAAECIIRISHDETMRQDLVSSGVISGIVSSLTFQDTLVQASTVQALGMLACDQNAREQIYTNGGIKPLLQLLQSSSKEVLKNAVWALMVCAQSPQLAEEAGRLRAIELVERIATSEHDQSAMLAKSALRTLLDANLPAKYWVTGSLDMTDSIVNIEFYDAGPALSSQPFISLYELTQQPLNKNQQPVITVSLLAKPPPPSNDDEGLVPTMDERQSNISINSRNKSRQQATKLKRGRAEHEAESRVSEESTEVPSDGSKPILPGLLEVDEGLWDHIQHVQTVIKLLPSARDQVEELAKYVAGHLGGQVERSGSICYELLASQIESERQCNLVPLGELHQGSFQHRSLLFKVLCDSLGVPCTLVRGEYSRHWNEVSVMDSSTGHNLFLVDLMFNPGALLPVNSPHAIQYQHI